MVPTIIKTREAADTEFVSVDALSHVRLSAVDIRRFAQPRTLEWELSQLIVSKMCVCVYTQRSQKPFSSTC